jgi:hypothetical protein
MPLPRGSYYARRRRQLNPPDHRPRAAVGRAPVGSRTTDTGPVVSDDRIMAWIWAILEQENPWYGYRNVTAVLRQQYGLLINPKKVDRLMKSWHWLWPDRPPKSRYPRQWARNWVITRPNPL